MAGARSLAHPHYHAIRAYVHVRCIQPDVFVLPNLRLERPKTPRNLPVLALAADLPHSVDTWSLGIRSMFLAFHQKINSPAGCTTSRTQPGCSKGGTGTMSCERSDVGRAEDADEEAPASGTNIYK